MTADGSTSTAGLDRQLWAAAIETAFADPQQPRLVFQPIVDLGRGVVAGYEALSRFEGGIDASPDRWFNEAARIGRMIDFEVRVLRSALDQRDSMPPNTFLSINVSPEALSSSEAEELFGEIASETVPILVERRPCIAHDCSVEEARAAFATSPGARSLVQVDATKRPLGLVHRSDVERGSWKAEPTVHVDPLTLVKDAAWRAMQRPESTRFAPLICTLPSGAYFGLIPIERIVAFLAK